MVCAADKNLEIVATPGGSYELPVSLYDVQITIKGNGDKNKKFELRGAKGIGTTLMGNSFIKIRGSNVVVTDISFKNNNIKFTDSEALLEIGQKSIQVNNIDVRNLRFIHNRSFNDLGKATQFQWIKITASQVSIINCVFDGKKNRLPVIHVEANYPGVFISKNIFKNIPPRKGEALEAISVGYMTGTSDCIISDNEFYNCKGDSETISCKSNNIRINNNVFRKCRSGISIRWGDNIEIVENEFQDTPTHIRITGSGHLIKANIFAKHTYGHIVLMKGDKNYRKVSHINIVNNVFLVPPVLAVMETTSNDSWPSTINFYNNYHGDEELDSKEISTSYFRSNHSTARRTGQNIKSYFYDLSKYETNNPIL